MKAKAKGSPQNPLVSFLLRRLIVVVVTVKTRKRKRRMRTHLWKLGILMAPTSTYQPSSLLRNVSTRPPIRLLASITVTLLMDIIPRFTSSF